MNFNNMLANNKRFDHDWIIIQCLQNIILEASTDAFYIKIMRFADFLRVQIHSWNANVS